MTKKGAIWGKLRSFAIRAGCHRTETARILKKSAVASAVNSAGKQGTAGETLGAVLGGRCLWKSRETTLLPAIPPAMQGEILYTPPPLPPFLAKRHFPVEGGGGVYFEAPRGRNFIRPPPLYTPPTPRRVFSGVGGWGCIKFGPVSNPVFPGTVPSTIGKIQTGAHKRGLKPQIFRENRGEILPGKSGLFGANWGLFGADRDQFLRTPQPRGKSRNCPERALFGPIGAFRAKPPFAKPPFGFPRHYPQHFLGNSGFVTPVAAGPDCKATQLPKSHP